MHIATAMFGAAALAMSTIAAAAEPVPAATTTTATIDPMQQVVCRRDRETGSLVKSKKTCHTRAQWQYIDDTNQAFGRDLVDTTRTRSGGN